jgi:transposase
MRRRGRPLAELVLTDSERTTLDQWTRRRTTAQALALRARIVLACATGRTNSQVAADARVTRPTVGRWRQRFVEDRCEGLLDEPKPGAPRRITDADVERVLTTTLESTPRDATQWSTRSLAKQCGMSQTAVARIWKAFALQPHRSETFKLSKDPLFIEKVRDIVGLYLNPPDRALVLCVDEKSQIQALDRTAPLLPMRPGQVERRTHDYVRYGTTSLFAALDAKTGAVVGRCFRRHRSREFRRFLDLVEDHVPRDLDVHLILDNYGTHKTSLIQRWLAKRPRFHLHFTPTSSSWLNLVERWFVELERKQIKRGAHRSVSALERAIYEYMDVTGEDPKPFVWTKTADEIFASIGRFCQRISNSGH